MDPKERGVAPLRREGYPLPGWSQGATAAELPDVAIFEVEVQVEGRHSRRGAAHVVQGIARLMDEPGEGGVGTTVSLYPVYWREPGPDPL